MQMIKEERFNPSKWGFCGLVVVLAQWTTFGCNTSDPTVLEKLRIFSL